MGFKKKVQEEKPPAEGLAHGRKCCCISCRGARSKPSKVAPGGKS